MALTQNTAYKECTCYPKCSNRAKNCRPWNTFVILAFGLHLRIRVYISQLKKKCLFLHLQKRLKGRGKCPQIRPLNRLTFLSERVGFQCFHFTEYVNYIIHSCCCCCSDFFLWLQTNKLLLQLHLCTVHL